VTRLLRRALAGVAFAVILYVAAIIWVEADDLAAALQGYKWSALAAAIALSSVNYALRFWKWELCLGWLRVRDEAPELGRGRSALIYLAGLSMSVTPGKVGEVLRSVLLRASDGVAFARTAPVIVADRLTDLVALVVLALMGTLEHPEYAPVMAVTMVLVVLGIAVLGSPRALRGILGLLGRLPGADGLVERTGTMVESSAVLLQWRRLAVLALISVAGWGLECVGYWMILHGFAGVDASLALCTFLWSITTLIGALSFLPAGLGATEGSLAVLVTSLAVGVTAASAVASTLLIRAATLWYGELVGATALAVFLRDPAVRERTRKAGREQAS
jgi:uncharacterized membrane protein YbhN (UPF0104 family)